MYIQIQVSNLNGLSEEIRVDVCNLENNTFSTLEVKLQNKSFVVLSDDSPKTLPATITNGSITVSIGSIPSKLQILSQTVYVFCGNRLIKCTGHCNFKVITK